VAESNGWVVFFKYAKGRPAKLREAGGVYTDFHSTLREKSRVSSQGTTSAGEAQPKTDSKNTKAVGNL
jgi:hypothetical protein